jgi:trans-aconitate methyltransferase
MADAGLPLARRFRAAAPHYLAGRPAYAARLIGLVARLTGLGVEDRVMDLGCGPGQLAAAFAPEVSEVIAIDPEPEMLRIADARFGTIGNIRFIRGSSFELPAGLGPLRLVTMGRSFHWMDRATTIELLDGMIEPGGVIALFGSETVDVPENAWVKEYQALVRRYGETDATHVRRRSGVWVRHEAILLDSSFSTLEQVAVIERHQVTIEHMVDRAFSRSSTAPDRLGDAAPRLAREIEALLCPIAHDGVLIEVVATNALLAWRAGEQL